MGKSYEYSACMATVVGPSPLTLERPVRSMPDPVLDVAGGISSGAKIVVHELLFNTQPFASVLIFPITCTLTPERICQLDGVFSDVQPVEVSRTFDKRTMEQLSQRFLFVTRREPPLTTHDYRGEIPVIHHGYGREYGEWIKAQVRDLKF